MYFGEPDRLFEGILCWPAGDGACSVSVGCDPRLIWTAFIAGLCDVAGQSEYPRNVVTLELFSFFFFALHGCN